MLQKKSSVELDSEKVVPKCYQIQNLGTQSTEPTLLKEIDAEVIQGSSEETSVRNTMKAFDK